MRIIPVIDLCQGQVVHAVAGQRDRYRPVRSQLCADSDPGNVVQAFLNIHPFATIYIADLDAIKGTGSNDRSIQQLLEHFTHLNFWIDRGMYNKPDLLKTTHPRISHVVGSETGFSPKLLCELRNLSPQPILSLDFRKGVLSGDHSLLQQPEAWPDNVILMNLDRVGTGSGFDTFLLDQIIKNTVHSRIFLGGGIRGIADMMHLYDRGIAGILIATALHTGRISSGDLKAMAHIDQKKMPR